MKLNLGCGTNLLTGWENHDAGVDITKMLPWKDGTVDFVFAEHVVEHVYYEQAIGFFRECRRILRVGGVVRIALPSIEKVWHEATPEYQKFVERWVKFDDGGVPGRRAMTNILFMHGHRAPWTEGLLLATLYYAGFDKVVARDVGISDHPELRGVEGHGQIIGDEFNRIETVVAEATKEN